MANKNTSSGSNKKNSYIISNQKYIGTPDNPKFINFYDKHYENIAISNVGLMKGTFFVLLIILVVNVLMRGSGATFMPFSSFLEVLQNAPQIPTDWISFGSRVPQAVYDFPVFGGFLKFFMSTLEVLLFIVTGLFQAISFMLYFIQVLFGISLF